jgi:hypothetical protein
MTFHHNPSTTPHRRSANSCGLDDSRNFVIGNADDLLWVATAAAGHNGRAAASDLVDAALCDTAPAEDIQDLLVIVRDFLSNAATRASDPWGANRPDLDAAVRWYGARLDEFIDQADRT